MLLLCLRHVGKRMQNMVDTLPSKSSKFPLATATKADTNKQSKTSVVVFLLLLFLLFLLLLLLL